ncbi:hypothetical protein [Roseateles violae]|uniref:Uncharacterized protein n=1 Tax=Roseateles violae TaxID=3058042 RepID=A0ABT8DM16_9BURK|nr:hypothetical protein [Pelomonas sp. PFR6]MDN3919449.1 hypothetical protein [Pelomonas sp. PFR6]
MRIRRLLFPTLVLGHVLGLMPALGLAQSSAPPSAREENIRRMMESTASPVVPNAARMADAILDAELRFAERPETAARIASFKRNLFEALVKKGFSAEQALQIVLHTPLPSAAGDR